MAALTFVMLSLTECNSRRDEIKYDKEGVKVDLKRESRKDLQELQQDINWNLK